MKYIALLTILIISQVYSAPQFITFKDGKIGVNFGGYHAGVGLGGLLGGGAGTGGLFAEAGTPHGQSARAGLGGAVDGNGRAGGGLYAGATAGGNVKAEAGLAGRVASEDVAGNGFATAQAGGHNAVSGLAGESSIAGASGVTFSGTKSIGISDQGVKLNEVHTDFNDALNEVKPLSSIGAEAKADAHFNIETESRPTVIVKEVDIEPQPQIIEKHIIHTHTKPHHNLHKTAYIGGFIGGAAKVAPQPPVVVYNTQPVIEKRLDVGAQSSANVGAVAESSGNGGGQVTYTKEVTVSRNPTLFQDIFNIPISALKAVSSFLSNTAANTNVSVQKSATIQAESDIISPKHSSSSSSSALSESHISVQTPSASQVIGDIFAVSF